MNIETVTSEQIEVLKDGEQLKVGRCTIERANRDCLRHDKIETVYLPDQYIFTYNKGCVSNCDYPEYIAADVNNYNKKMNDIKGKLLNYMPNL